MLLKVAYFALLLFITDQIVKHCTHRPPINAAMRAYLSAPKIECL